MSLQLLCRTVNTVFSQMLNCLQIQTSRLVGQTKGEISDRAQNVEGKLATTPSMVGNGRPSGR